MSDMNTPFCWKRFCWRSCLFSLEALALIAVFVAALVGVFVWRLSVSPLDLDFAKPTVEKALSNQAQGHSVTIEQLILHWPDRSGPLLLGIRGGAIHSADGGDLINIEEVGMGLSLPHLFIGKIVPTSLVLSKPHMSVVVATDGRIDVGLGNTETDAAFIQDEQESLLERIMGYVGSPYHDQDSSPLSALERFEIHQAVVDVEDQYTGTNWGIPRFDVVLQTERDGLGGAFDVFLDEQAKEAQVSGDLKMPWKARDVSLKVRLRDIPLSFLAGKIKGADALADQNMVVSALLSAHLDQDLKPLDGSIEVTSPGGALSIDSYRAEPVEVSAVSLKARYAQDPEILSLDDVSFSLSGVPFHLSGQVRGDGAEGVSYLADLKADIASLDQEQFGQILPDATKEEAFHEWLTSRLSGGQFTGVNAQASVALSQGEQGWDYDVHSLKAGFGYDGMTINYRAPLLPITQATGSGWFDYVSEILHVDLSSGKVGNMDASAGEVELAHIIEGGKGIADVNVTLSGELTDMLSYLEAEPIAFKHGYDLSRVKGHAKVKVNTGLPTHGQVSMDDVVLNVHGDLQDVVLPSILQEADLTNANAKLVVDGNDVVVTGTGDYINNPIRFDYEGFLSASDQKYKEKIKFSGRINKQLMDHFDLDLSSFLTVPADVSATYVDYGARETLDVKADLKPAHLFVDSLGYDKAQGQRGDATFRVDFEKGIPTQIDNLSVKADGLSLDNGRIVFVQRAGKTELSQGKIARLQVGDTKGSAEFEVNDSGHYKVAADLDVLDLRPVLEAGESEKDTEDHAPLLLMVNAKRILTNTDKSITQGKIYSDSDKQGRFNQLELDALTPSGSDIYLRYKFNEQGNRAFRFEADDAGETLAAFGLYDKIRGGKILVHAEPMQGGEDRNLIGVAEITNFEVVGAPTLAKLLSLMSLEGLAKGLTNTGIQFTRLESKFDWLYRPQGSLLVLQEGRTSGAAVGLTFDGVIDQAASTIDLSGTIVPVSEVNKVIRSIPLIGEILTGGTGVFAATYAVKGKTSNPDVSINPLSVLAPGIVRRILFE